MLLSRLAKILLPAAVFGLVACSDDNIQQPDTSQNLDGSVEQKLEARIDGVQYNEGGLPLEKATPDKWNDNDIKPPNNYKGKTGGKVPVGGPIPEVSGQGKKGDVKWKYKITNPSQGLDGNIAAGVLPKTTTGSARKIAFDWDTTLPINGKVPTSGTFTIEYIACNNLNQTLCQSTKRTVELTTGNSDPIIDHYVINASVDGSALNIEASGKDPDGDSTTWSIGKNDFGPYALLSGGRFITKGPMTAGKTGTVEFILTDSKNAATKQSVNVTIDKYSHTIEVQYTGTSGTQKASVYTGALVAAALMNCGATNCGQTPYTPNTPLTYQVHCQDAKTKPQVATVLANYGKLSGAAKTRWNHSDTQSNMTAADTVIKKAVTGGCTTYNDLIFTVIVK